MKRVLRSEAAVPSRPKILIDINVVLDVVLKREPFYEHSAAVLERCELLLAEGYVAGHTLTTLYYLTRRTSGERAARDALATLLELVTVMELPTRGYQWALGLGLPHFEDAVQAVAALHVKADFLVTRDEKHFRGVPGLEVRSPTQMVALG